MQYEEEKKPWEYEEERFVRVYDLASALYIQDADVIRDKGADKAARIAVWRALEFDSIATKEIAKCPVK